MTPYERDVLEEIAEPGSVKGLRSGAAIMVALECLQARGYVTRGGHPKITDKGREALEVRITTDRYGKRRVSKMLAEWNRLREAVREGNLEGIQNAFDACEEWIDYAFGQNKGENHD